MLAACLFIQMIMAVRTTTARSMAPPSIASWALPERLVAVASSAMPAAKLAPKASAAPIQMCGQNRRCSMRAR